MDVGSVTFTWLGASSLGLAILLGLVSLVGNFGGLWAALVCALLGALGVAMLTSRR